jgi:arylsulfatase A-like enzyme
MTNNVAIFFSSSSAPEKFADKNMNFLLPPQDFRTTNNPAPALPMIVWRPGVVHPGGVSGQAWSAVDFAPTAMEISLQPVPTTFTGHSVLPVLRARHTVGNK